MAAASYTQSSFAGGEWAKAMQGRFDRPDYRTAMNVCINALPIDTGAWMRRPGFRYLGTTRNGAQARTIKFDFQSSVPHTLEFTLGFLRAWNGDALVTTNDANTITSISTANPAVLTLGTATATWATADQAMISGLGTLCPLLQNRQLALTKVDTTHFSIADAITGTAIDGSTLGWSTPSTAPTITRIKEFVTPYTLTDLAGIRSVQAETQAILLSQLRPSQVLAVSTFPTPTADAVFTLTAADFLDGPYLDPVAHGARVTPSAKTGIVNLVMDFPAWSATKAYAVGDYVTYSSVSYVALTGQNVNLQPDTHGTNWAVTAAAAAIGAHGFVATDIGRLVRLFSEPADWAVGTTYATDAVVKYAGAYWTALASTTGNIPGVSLAKWGVATTAAKWTWGQITSLLNLISPTLSGTVHIGSLTSNGGLSAAFDSVIAKSLATSAVWNDIAHGPPNVQALSQMIGQDYHSASAQAISFATLYAPTNADIFALSGSASSYYWNYSVTFNLRGSSSSPAGVPSAGTLLGSSPTYTATLNDTSSNPIPTAVSIISSDQTTTFNYVWIEVVGTYVAGGHGAPGTSLWSAVLATSQMQIGTPASGSSDGVAVQLRGDDLLYTSPISVWRLGVYSNTTGFPTCGTYHEGRLWLAGVTDNRIDGCVANGINGANINFAPTETDGTVTDASAISYTFNAPDVSAIYWMLPDQQGIVNGTLTGEWLIQATANNNVLTPTNMQAHRVTTIGCANIEPHRTEHTTIFVQRHQRKVMEYFADVYSGKFSAPNLSLTAKHLAARVIEEIAYQRELAPIIWARCGDGSLVGATYKRDSLTTSQGPTFIGWHQHVLGSARMVESMTVGASSDGTLDALTIVSNDPAVNVRHIEQSQNLWEEGGAATDAWFLDDAMTPTSTENVTVAGVPSFQLHGLWHLNGKTVTVFAGGLDCGDVLVTNGSCSVAYGAAGGLFTTSFVSSFTDGIPVVAGFSYNSDGQIVRPISREESGARNGPALGKTGREHLFGALLVDTQGIKFGATFDLLTTANLKSAGGTVALAQNELFSGVLTDRPKGTYGLDNMLCWRVSRPFPATVCAVEPFLHTQDQ